ncbi:MAG: hypothetical protein HOE19_03980 [Candidatus Komeilibacteria bacterium]|jgi:hypothetical protein|nr:hypothetical protein [Candidatus Komeilibacteria bacterium]MBT4447833.1 hypothetical protein [Candidatus Komeilibacteria bacterium]
MKKLITLIVLVLIIAGLVSLAVSQNNNDPRVSELVAVAYHCEAVDKDVPDMERFYNSPIEYISVDQLDAYIAFLVQQDQEESASFDEMPDHWHYIDRRLVRIRVAPATMTPDLESGIPTLQGEHLGWEAIWTYQEDALPLETDDSDS